MNTETAIALDARTVLRRATLRMSELAPVWAAFLIRFTLLVIVFRFRGLSALMAPDTASYLDPARTLLHGHFGWPVPEIDRTPGYPLFEALTGLWNGHLVWIVIAQIALDCVSTWLVMRIARQLSGSFKVGMLAGYLYAIEPLAIRYSCLLLSDTLYLALFLAMTSALLDYRRQPRWSSLVHAWIWLVVSAYVRPTSYYLPFVVSGYLLFQPRELRFRQRLKTSLATVLVCMSAMGVWQVRNDIVAGYRGYSSVQEINLYYYLAAGVQAKLEHRSILAVQDDLKMQLARNPNAATWSRAQKLAFMKREALGMIASHPWVYARLHLIGMARVLFGPNSASIVRLTNGLNDRPDQMTAGPLRSARWMLAHMPVALFLIALVVTLETAYYATALLGIVRGKAPGQGLLLWMAFYFAIVTGGPQADSRYRLPIVACACALAAIGIIGQLQAKRKLEEHCYISPAEVSV